MRWPCLLTYLSEALQDCGWSVLLSVDGSGLPHMAPWGLCHSLAGGPCDCPSALVLPPQHTRCKDPNVAEKKGTQLCLLVDSALWALGLPWTVTYMYKGLRSLPTSEGVRYPGPTQDQSQTSWMELGEARPVAERLSHVPGCQTMLHPPFPPASC